MTAQGLDLDLGGGKGPQRPLGQVLCFNTADQRHVPKCKDTGQSNERVVPYLPLAIVLGAEGRLD